LDKVFIDLIGKATGNKNVVFSIGYNTAFLREDDSLIVQYKTKNGEVIEHTLKTIEELVEGDAAFESSDDDWMDRYLPLLSAIEAAIARTYKADPNLKDKMVLTVIDRLIIRPDIRMASDLINAIQTNMRLILSTTKYSRKEVIGCLKKVQKSIKRHHSVNGPTGYLDFIKERI
jgi:hypothetical protein